MGMSENSVPLNPMVNDHYPYQMAIIGNIPYFQTNPYVFYNMYIIKYIFQTWLIGVISRHLVFFVFFPTNSWG